jgi:hypothetical protein
LFNFFSTMEHWHLLLPVEQFGIPAIRQLPLSNAGADGGT